MSGHTPEPWRCVGGTLGLGYAILGDDNTQVTPILTDDANARRIVACVNACAGIPTEALEAGALAEVIRVLDVARGYIKPGAGVVDHAIALALAKLAGPK